MVPEPLKRYCSWRPRPGERGGDGLHHCLGARAEENTSFPFHSSAPDSRGFCLQCKGALEATVCRHCTGTEAPPPTPRPTLLAVVKPTGKPCPSSKLDLLLLSPQPSKEHGVKLRSNILST